MAMLRLILSGFLVSLVVAQDSCSNRCGRECCDDDEECQFNSTCVKGKKIYCSDGLSYCLEPTKCCEFMTCCPSNSECCGYSTCCPVGAKCCGISTCCPPDSTCCGFSTCCAKGSICDSGICKRNSGYISSRFSWYYLSGVLLPMAVLIAVCNYRRRRQQWLQRAYSQRPTGGQVIRTGDNDMIAPVVVTSAGYDQGPPPYDAVTRNNETANQQSDVAPPSYYELYKDTDAILNEQEPSRNTCEQTNSPSVPENSAESNRNERANS